MPTNAMGDDLFATGEAYTAFENTAQLRKPTPPNYPKKLPSSDGVRPHPGS